MAGQTRHKTTIEIGVDDREISGLERALSRAFDPKRLDQFEASLERVARTMEKISGVSATAPSAAPAGAAGGGGGGGSGNQDLIRAIEGLKEIMVRQNKEMKRGGGSFSMRGMMQTALGTAGGNMLYGGARGALGTANSLGTAAASGNFIQAALGSIPLIGGFLGGAAQSTIGLYREHAQQQMAQASAFGATGIGNMNPLVREGVNTYGLNPSQVPGMVSQFGGQSGLSGRALGDAFSTQLDMSQLMGIQSAGSIVGAAGTSGGEVRDPGRMMREAVGSGIIAGFRETRIDQYLQGLSSFVEEARSRGIPIDPTKAMQLMTSFTGSGDSFQGEAGANFAQSVGRGVGGAGRGSGFAHGMALRAAGLGSGATYQQALEQLENRDPATIARFVQQIQQTTSDPEAGAFMMRQAMEQLGVDMSAVQARELFQNGMDGNMDPGGMESVSDQRQYERRDAAGGVFGAGAALGGLQLRRQELGGELSGAALGLMTTELAVMQEILPAIAPILQGAAGTVKEALEAYKTGGMSGLMDYLMDMLTPSNPVGEAHRQVERNRIRTQQQNQARTRTVAVTESRQQLIAAAAANGQAVQFPGQTAEGATLAARAAVQFPANGSGGHSVAMSAQAAQALSFSLISAGEAAAAYAAEAQGADIGTDVSSINQ